MQQQRASAAKKLMKKKQAGWSVLLTEVREGFLEEVDNKGVAQGRRSGREFHVGGNP